jgi:hypothetical protein
VSSRSSQLAVWKYPLDTIEMQRVAMPAGGRPLFVAEQHGQLTLWALVDVDAPPVPRTLLIVGAGHLAAAGEYIGSAMLAAGNLVFHVFDGGEGK